MEDKVGKIWKYAAIVLAVLLVLETAFVAFIMKMGYDEITAEEECAQVLCAMKEGAVSYYYENGICYCIDVYGEYVAVEKIR